MLRLSKHVYPMYGGLDGLDSHSDGNYREFPHCLKWNLHVYEHYTFLPNIKFKANFNKSPPWRELPPSQRHRQSSPYSFFATTPPTGPPHIGLLPMAPTSKAQTPPLDLANAIEKPNRTCHQIEPSIFNRGPHSQCIHDWCQRRST